MLVALFANIFSHSVGCLFVLFMVSFAVQKLLSLIGSHFLFLFCFFPLFWETDRKRYGYDSCQSVLPMFSSKSFIVSSLTFRSLINFEFIFEYGVKECSNFIFFTCSCPFFPAPFIEETVFPPLYSFASFVVD